MSSALFLSTPMAATAASRIRFQPGAAPPYRAPAPQRSWVADPPISAKTAGFVELSDVRLWCWDSGGLGEAIVLLHPFTGSDAIWGYQYQAFVQAGYRVVAYSRRGFGRSETGTKEAPGTAADDLNGIADKIGLERFHLLGTAAGGFVVPDYALNYPSRVLTVILANTLGGIVDPSYQRTTQQLIPANFSALPPEFRELSPSYRAANPVGAARWRDLEAHAQTGPVVTQPPRSVVTLESLKNIKAPTLLLTGDADPFMPPPRLEQLAAFMPGAEVVTIPEAGHSAYWEQPLLFNKTVLNFLSKPRPLSRG